MVHFQSCFYLVHLLHCSNSHILCTPVLFSCSTLWSICRVNSVVGALLHCSGSHISCIPCHFFPQALFVLYSISMVHLQSCKVLSCRVVQLDLIVCFVSTVVLVSFSQIYFMDQLYGPSAELLLHLVHLLHCSSSHILCTPVSFSCPSSFLLYSMFHLQSCKVLDCLLCFNCSHFILTALFNGSTLLLWLGHFLSWCLCCPKLLSCSTFLHIAF